MFGRYSLDVPGLAYAGGEWDDSKYTTFKADKDSIIPICDDEYFADDIVGRFIRFIEVVYGKETLQENLRLDTRAGAFCVCYIPQAERKMHLPPDTQCAGGADFADGDKPDARFCA